MAVVGADPRVEREDIYRAINGKTVCSAFAATAGRHGDVEALRWREPDGWRALTYEQYRDRVRAATMGLVGLGFGPGQFGVIMARTRPEHVIADLALVHAGGTSVSLYNTLAPEQIEYVVNHCQATVAIVEDAAFLARFDAVRGRLPKLRHVILLEGEAPGTTTWAALLAAGAKAAAEDPEAFERAWQAVGPKDLVNVLYTSGTTGPPKGVMYSHENILWICESSRRLLEPDGIVAPGNRFVSYLPLAHIAERFNGHYFAGVYCGSTVSYIPDLTQLPAALLEVRPVAFVGVPRLWEKFHAAINAGLAAEPDAARREGIAKAIETGGKLAAYAARGEEPPPALAAARAAIAPVQQAIKAKLGLDQCIFAVTSTAPIPVAVEEFFAAIGLPLVEVWGMSELTGPATITPIHRIKPGTVGVAYPGVEVRLGPDGEILARGGNVMQGYYQQPEQTAEAIDGDGWMHSGDIGSVDDDGYFKIVDRKKELIVTAYGKNVAPANLEGLLLHHPLVGFACVVGDGRPYVAALIVLDNQVAPQWAAARGIEFGSMADLARHPEVLAAIQAGVDEANSHVSNAEQVKRFQVLPVEWSPESEELTPTLKLKRRVVSTKYAEEIARLYD